MKPTDISVLMELASAGPQDEFTETFGLNAEMQAALKEELQRERQEKMGHAVKRIVELMKDTSEAKQAQVFKIRQARAQEKEAKAQLEKIERAIAYANETSNYLPLVFLTKPLVKTTIQINDENRNKFHVPAEWKPASEVAVKAAAKTPARKK